MAQQDIDTTIFNGNVDIQPHPSDTTLYGNGSLEVYNTIYVDTINEHTSASGVTIDSVLLKDNTAKALTFESTTSTGTAPFIIASTTLVTNLNADFLDGQQAPSSTIVGTTDTQTLSGKSLVDSSTWFIDDIDPTKKIQFQLSGLTTGTTRTLTIPDATTTMVGTDVIQTLTNKVINSSSNTIGATELRNSSDSVNISASLAPTGNGQLIETTSTTTAIWKYPNFRKPVRVATTSALTLATDFENGDTVDDITLVTNDRILIKNQAIGSENGIYTVNVSGAPTRSDDYALGFAVNSTMCFVNTGTTNGNSIWACANSIGSDLVGTDALTFIEITQTAGGGGEANTGSNVGTSGVGVYKQNSGIVLEFKKINAGSNKITITDNTGISTVDIDAIPDNIMPTTTKGDLIVYNGTTNVRLPIATFDNRLLFSDSTTATGVDWKNPSGSIINATFSTTFDTISTTFVLVNTFIYPGTNLVGEIQSTQFIYHTSAATTGEFQLYNVTSATVLIGGISAPTSTTNTILTFNPTSITYPTTPVIIELQVRKVTGTAGNRIFTNGCTIVTYGNSLVA